QAQRWNETSRFGGTCMAATTQTQRKHMPKNEAPGTEKTTSGELFLRDELRGDSQQFFRTFFRIRVRLALVPVYPQPDAVVGDPGTANHDISCEIKRYLAKQHVVYDELLVLRLV